MFKNKLNTKRFGTTISTKIFIIIMITMIMLLVLYGVYLDSGGNWIFFIFSIIFTYLVLYLLNGLFYSLEFNVEHHKVNLGSLFKNRIIFVNELKSWETFKTWSGLSIISRTAEVLFFEFKNGDNFTFPLSFTFKAKNTELKELFSTVLESRPQNYRFFGYRECIRKFGLRYLFLF